jgi:protein translocase SecG subunit
VTTSRGDARRQESEEIMLTILWWVLIVLYIPSCIGLIIFVLLQKGKGTGFAGAFGVGGGSDTVFGPRTSRSLPQRITYIMAAIYMVFALLLSIITGRVSHGSAPKLEDTSVVEDVQKRLNELEKKPGEDAAATKDLKPGASATTTTTTPISVTTTPATTTPATPAPAPAAPAAAPAAMPKPDGAAAPAEAKSEEAKPAEAKAEEAKPAEAPSEKPATDANAKPAAEEKPSAQ